MSKSSFSRLWRGLLYLAFLTLCVEVALQGFYYFTAGDFLFKRVGLPIFAREPYAGFGNRPGLSLDHRTNEFHAHYYVNQVGFRVPRPGLEYTVAKPSDTFRIMLLGPSFAYGWGVEYDQSFAGVLQQLLQERRFAGDKKIEVINAGVPSMAMIPQTAWFENVGKRYQPDFVIQFLYGSMMVPHPVKLDNPVDDEGNLVLQNDTAGRWRERLKNLATVFYAWTLWTEFSGERSRAVQGAGREMSAPANFDPESPDVRASMNAYGKLASVVHDANARLLLLYLPLSYAIHPEDEKRWQHLGVMDSQKQMAMDGAFVRRLNACQIPTLDITQPLQAAAKSGKRMYYWLDIHWTAAGNATAAQAVASYLSGSSALAQSNNTRVPEAVYDCGLANR